MLVLCWGLGGRSVGELIAQGVCTAAEWNVRLTQLHRRVHRLNTSRTSRCAGQSVLVWLRVAQ